MDSPDAQTPQHKRKRMKYSQDSLITAMEKVKSKELSLRRASLEYGIPRATLYDKIHGRVPVDSVLGHPAYITMEEEDQIVQWIKSADKRGLPARKDEVLNTAQLLVMSASGRQHPFKGGRPGDFWWKGFLSRHPGLPIRERSSKIRNQFSATESPIRLWFENLHKNLSDDDLVGMIDDSTRVFNCDEMCLKLCPRTSTVLGPKEWRNYYLVPKVPKKSALTFVGTVSAKGENVAPAIIYPYARIQSDIKSTLPQEFMELKNNSGWMTHETFSKYVLEHFDNWLTLNDITRPVIMFVDGIKSHITLDLCMKSKEKGIIIHLLPPNTTHMLHPAYAGFINYLRQYFIKIGVKKQPSDSDTLIKTKDVAPKIKCILNKVKNESIVKGFERCGLYPLNVEAVDLSKCNNSEVEDSFEVTEDEDDLSHLNENSSIAGQKIKKNIKIKKKLVEVPRLKRKRIKYSQESLVAALTKVQSKEMSIRKASKEYGIPRATLFDKINGKVPLETVIGHPTYLTREEEEEIVQWISAANKSGFPARKDEVLNIAQQIVLANPDRKHPFKDGRPGYFWWRSFLTRHPELAIRVPEREPDVHASDTEEHDVEENEECFSTENYKTALQIIEHEIGKKKIKKNVNSRTTMSKDLYDLYMSIKLKSEETLPSSSSDMSANFNNTSIMIPNLNNEYTLQIMDMQDAYY